MESSMVMKTDWPAGQGRSRPSSAVCYRPRLADHQTKIEIFYFSSTELKPTRGVVAGF